MGAIFPYKKIAPIVRKALLADGRFCTFVGFYSAAR
jgi:hypothetical protein